MLGAGTVDVRPAPVGARQGARHDSHHPYEQHRPEETVLFRVLQAHWKTFLNDLEAAGPDAGALPAFVVSEIEAFRQRSRRPRADGAVPGPTPIATDRLSMLDGRLELRLKRQWRDGTTAFVFQPRELIERLVAIVPRPRAHLIRYSGVLAPAFAARAEIVPAAEEPAPPQPSPPPGAEMPKGPGRIPWAPLLWRVFLADVLQCARCGGRMRIVAAVTSSVSRNLG